MRTPGSFAPSQASQRRVGLRLQLTIAFGLLVVVFLIALALTLAGTLRVRQITQQTQAEQYMSRLASDIAIQTLLCRRFEKDFFLNIGDKAAQADYRAHWGDAFMKLDRTVRDFSAAAVTDADRQQANIWRTESTAYQITFMNVERAIVEGRIDTPRAANAELAPFKDSIRTLTDTAVATARDKDIHVEQASAYLEAASANQIWINLLIGLLALLIGLACAILFPARLIQPVIELRRVTGKLACGDMAARTTIDRGDEIGDLAASFNQMASTIQQHTADLEQQHTVTEAARIEAEKAHAAIAAQLSTIEDQRTVIREMSVPMLPLSKTALVLPLIGALDSTRLQLIQEQALRRIERSAVRLLILDVTGVPLIDEVVANGLLEVIRAARLLGSETVLVGIRPEIAQTIVGLGLSLGSIVTQSTLQDGISYALSRR